jgi:hypothetical protein
LELLGRVKSGTQEISFSIKGLNGSRACEGFFTLPLAAAASDSSVIAKWRAEAQLDMKLR